MPAFYGPNFLLYCIPKILSTGLSQLYPIVQLPFLVRTGPETRREKEAQLDWRLFCTVFPYNCKQQSKASA